MKEMLIKVLWCLNPENTFESWMTLHPLPVTVVVGS